MEVFVCAQATAAAMALTGVLLPSLANGLSAILHTKSSVNVSGNARIPDSGASIIVAYLQTMGPVSPS
jgi:hypothetical protein